MRQRTKMLSIIAMVFMAIASTLTLTAGPAAALTNVYKIQTRLTYGGARLCLDADANHAGAGAVVSVVTCNNNNAQRWQLGTLNGFSVYINVGHPGYALAVNSLTAGSAAVLKAASGTNTTEHWQNDVLYNESGVIYNVHNNMVLEPTSITNGAHVYLRAYEGIVGTQSWLWTRIS